MSFYSRMLPIDFCFARAGALTTDDFERWIREIPLYVMFYEGIMQAPLRRHFASNPSSPRSPATSPLRPLPPAPHRATLQRALNPKRQLRRLGVESGRRRQGQTIAAIPQRLHPLPADMAAPGCSTPSTGLSTSTFAESRLILILKF